MTILVCIEKLESSFSLSHQNKELKPSEQNRNGPISQESQAGDGDGLIQLITRLTLTTVSKYWQWDLLWNVSIECLGTSHVGGLGQHGRLARARSSNQQERNITAKWSTNVFLNLDMWHITWQFHVFITWHISVQRCTEVLHFSFTYKWLY